MVPTEGILKSDWRFIKFTLAIVCRMSWKEARMEVDKQCEKWICFKYVLEI